MHKSTPRLQQWSTRSLRFDWIHFSSIIPTWKNAASLRNSQNGLVSDSIGVAVPCAVASSYQSTINMAFLVAYAGRSVDGSEPRYRFPSGFRKSLELYGLHRCKRISVVLVEGFFDTLKVVQAGFDAVALMGSTLSPHQSTLLLERFCEGILLLDGDDAGRRATEHIANSLTPAIRTRVVIVPDGYQPDCLSTDKIADLVTKARTLDGRRS